MFWILYFVAIPLFALMLIGGITFVVLDTRRYLARGKRMQQELESLRLAANSGEPPRKRVSCTVTIPAGHPALAADL